MKKLLIFLLAIFIATQCFADIRVTKPVKGNQKCIAEGQEITFSSIIALPHEMTVDFKVYHDDFVFAVQKVCPNWSYIQYSDIYTINVDYLFVAAPRFTFSREGLLTDWAYLLFSRDQIEKLFRQ